ncbi:MAG TPA: TIGR04255 family protein [candidate division Zixibacteria bacterium]|nr:TIGR04255 family protein [candidate division Zixibacteria bacterium]
MAESDPYKQIQYKQTNLNEVIARIDFISPMERFHETIPGELTKTIVKVFEIPEQKQKEVSITLDRPSTSWVFRSREGNKKIIVNTEYLLFIYKSYESFEKLKSEILPIVKQLFTSQVELIARRFGLRYINKIPGTNSDITYWEEELCPDLLNIFSILPHYKSNIARAFHNLSWNHGNMIVNFNFGLHNKDYPAAAKDKTYILDIDAYHEGALEIDDILERFDLYHSRIQEAFESSITDNLRKRMGHPNGQRREITKRATRTRSNKSTR